ncbi:MAG: FkbM family methyltransferase [Anaerolineae bacterium]|nr:FkbM family methyltransferase [Anaerolineae bacterium]
MWRSFIERLSRRVIVRRRLPSRFGGGRLVCTPGASLRYWQPSLERVDPWLLGMVEELVKPGDVVWDIGANVGLFAFAAAGLAGDRGKVLAVEPDTWLVDLLRRSARLNPELPVDILPVAVSASVEVSTFYIARRLRALNSLAGGTLSDDNAREKQLVMTISLDWLLDHYDRPRVLKIDVEGVEANVLSGAARLLREVRPVILCEVIGRNADSVTRMLTDANYTLYDAELRPAKRVPLSRASVNTLALPNDVD